MTESNMEPTDGRTAHLQHVAELGEAFLAGQLSGTAFLGLRSQAVDALLTDLWETLTQREDSLAEDLALIAVGGYGRQELFPASDVDILFVVEDAPTEKRVQSAVRRLSQQLWDLGLRVAATTRLLPECERFQAENSEFALALLDARPITGSQRLAEKLVQQTVPKLLQRDGKQLCARLLELVDERHRRYGNTLFHLEPNIKECPGGLRDANVCTWLNRLGADAKSPGPLFNEAFEFLAAVRVFLHLRSGRDVNALDWKTQDAAAAAGIGIPDRVSRDAAHWMQLYFRHARVVARRLGQQMDSLPKARQLFRLPSSLLRSASGARGPRVERGRVTLPEPTPAYDPAHDADIVLQAFEAVASSGAHLSQETEDRLEDAVPELSSSLGEDSTVWQRFRLILVAPYAGTALRSMHALGVLELLLPEFHGIDALVIRDAYHRYTVDEHTFVLIDTLHNLPVAAEGPMGEWKKRFAAIARDLQHPDLLYLAALLHDTGKGRSTGEHTVESARLAASVLSRLELDDYQARLVLTLITNHLEMSAALRRDIFDAETVRAFAAKVQAPEELRMLTLFTFADIHAVHPDALTPWKAENLWRLYIATSNYLDRNLDEERIDARVSSELVLRVTQSLADESREVMQFLEGFPQRYLQTRSPEQIRTHYSMSKRLRDDPVQLHFQWHKDRSEVALVTPDQQLLFARIVGVLAAWGMSVITADAFSNADGLVVDSFRFTDTFKTLELNPSERERLIRNIHDAIADPGLAAQMVLGRKRSRLRPPLIQVATSVHFDPQASTHATLLQVVSQDLPGLLYAISTSLGEARCNIKVAVIDTEGDTAIDVFYLTRQDQPLDPAELPALRDRILAAIEGNAS